MVALAVLFVAAATSACGAAAARGPKAASPTSVPSSAGSGTSAPARPSIPFVGTAADNWAVIGLIPGTLPTSPPPGFSSSELANAANAARLWASSAFFDSRVLSGRDPVHALLTSLPTGVAKQLPPASKLKGVTLLGYADVLAPSAEPWMMARAMGQWSVAGSSSAGKRVLVLTWKGSILIPVRSRSGSGKTIVGVYRDVHFTWAPSLYRASSDGFTNFNEQIDLVDVAKCPTYRTGTLVPDYSKDDVSAMIAHPTSPPPGSSTSLQALKRSCG